MARLFTSLFSLSNRFVTGMRSTGLFFSAAARRAVAVCCEHPRPQLKFSTAHAAKGIEADVVVVLVLSTGRYGFPSGVTGDPLPVARPG